jgi:hypothetical protein
MGGIAVCCHETAKPDKLAVIWSSADKEVARNMVFMYSKNAKKKGWWGDVCLVVWGPSGELLGQDADWQAELKEMLAAGVDVIACKACADNLGTTAQLEALGVRVFYVGQEVTAMLKNGWTVLTF